MKRLMVLCGLIVIGLASCENDSVKAAEPVVDTTRRLKIVVGDRALTAVLYANPTARDFASRLPLTVDLSDYGGAEKIFTPSPALTTDGSPSGLVPQAGDITVYAPWRNIAIFYRKGTSSGSLIPVGRIESGVNVLEVPGAIKNVRFELIEVKP